MQERDAEMASVGVDHTSRHEGSGRPRYRQLKPRPGHSGRVVAEHQRGRIHAATIELVDEAGYDALTVVRIVRAAGVSKRTFYENFSDKEDCFFATYDLIVRHTAREILAAQRRQGSRRDQIRAGILVFVREVAENPKAARLALVEVYNAGSAALERIDHTSGLFEALVKASVDADCDVELSSLIVKGIVAGFSRVARARLLEGCEHELLRAPGELEEWMLSLCFDEAWEVCRPFRAARLAGRAEVAGSDRDGAVALGDHPLGPDERSLILCAVMRLTAREGYGSLTVPRIRTAAGVSRRSFDAHFEGVSDCFLAALEWNAQTFLAEARAARLSSRGWAARVHRVLTALCAQIADHSAVGKLGFVEVFAPGEEGVRWRVSFVASMSEFLRNGAPPDQRPPEVAAEASVAAVCTVLRHYIATGQVRWLREAAGLLSYFVLAPVIGAAGAATTIRAEQARRTGISEAALSAGNKRIGAAELEAKRRRSV